MSSLQIRICPESPECRAEIDDLNEQAFGPGRFVRTAYRVRAGSQPDPALSFVAMMAASGDPERLVGSVRQTPIRVGDRTCWFLGPLIVSPACRNLGIGRELMNRTLHAAAQREADFILLVGDLPYYGRFGFSQIPPGRIQLPGPVDPARLLVWAGSGRAVEDLAGAVMAMAQKDHTD